MRSCHEKARPRRTRVKGGTGRRHKPPALRPSENAGRSSPTGPREGPKPGISTRFGCIALRVNNLRMRLSRCGKDQDSNSEPTGPGSSNGRGKTTKSTLPWCRWRQRSRSDMRTSLRCVRTACHAPASAVPRAAPTSSNVTTPATPSARPSRRCAPPAVARWKRADRRPADGD